MNYRSWDYTCWKPSREGNSPRRYLIVSLHVNTNHARNQHCGRVFFRSIAPDVVQRSTLIERASIVVLRYTDNPAENFLTFEGATRKKAIDRIMATLLSVNWAWPLAAWSASTGRPNPMGDKSACTFRVVAKRTTKSKVTKKLLPSDVFARSV